MKARQIIGAILMVILTIAGIVLSFGIAITSKLNSEGILKSMIKTGYLAKSEDKAYHVLCNYLAEDKVEKILEEISVKSQIREIAEAFDNNTVAEVADSMKQEVEEQIISVIDKNIPEETKKSFVNVVSTSYIKTIFPVTELDLLSGIYKTYSTKILFAIIILALICVVIYIYLALGKKTYKWAIIAMYNVIILNIILVIALGALNGIVIGDTMTTQVILYILGSVKTTVLLICLIILLIAIVSNYIAYFKKRKHSSKR